MTSQLSHVMTLANSIIGVSVLAMPFCFKQCGIILATLVLLLSSVLSRLACHFLVKSAVMSRRRNFEFLAFHAFGHMGKFLVELSIIGFLLGTCVAFFVVVGDLGPEIIGKVLDKRPEDIRNSLLITTSVFIVLPLGLLRNIDSLSSISTATIVFYGCLVLKVVAESTQHIFAGDWYDNVYYWRPAGILQCLPIFSMALFCQTQLFEIYEAIPNASLEKMNEVVRGALNICTLVYLCVGFFGYVAFCTQSFAGNILMSFEPGVSSEMIKMGFVISVAFSFPLVIFPCRASLNFLLFRRVYTHEPTMNYIPETRFRCLTIAIVGISVIIGILIPNIEFVLGLVGSTIGVMICLIFPAAFFISISSKNTNERLLAQAILFIGLWIMILGTYANLYAMEESSNTKITITTTKPLSQINNLPLNLIKDDIHAMQEIPNNPKILPNVKEKINLLSSIKKIDKSVALKDVRQEPPIPVERVIVTEKSVLETQKPIMNEVVTFAPEIKEIVDKIKTLDEDLNKKSNDIVKNNENEKVMDSVSPQAENKVEAVELKGNVQEMQKNDNLINFDAIKKEELELAADRDVANIIAAERHEELKKTLEKHMLQQLLMMQEQKKLLKDIKEQKRELEREKQRIAQDVKKLVENEKKEQSNNKMSNAKENNRTMLKHDINMEMTEAYLKNNIYKQKQIYSKKNVDKILSDSGENEGTNLKIIKTKKTVEESVNNVNDGNVESINTQKSFPANEEAKNEIPKNLVIDKQENTDTEIKVNDLPIELKKPIVNTLTKRILESSVAKDALIKKEEDRRLTYENEMNRINEIDTMQKISETKDDILKAQNQYSVPIVMRMKNQTRSDNKSVQLSNQSDNDVQAIRRDILENHEREKREIREQNDTDTKMNSIQKSEEVNSFVKDVSEDINLEKCSKLVNNFQSEKSQDSKSGGIDQKLLEATSMPASLIKTNIYLSGQEFRNTVPVDPSINLGLRYVKMKQRDLKALKSSESNHE